MIIENVFTLEEIKKLQHCCDSQPIKSTTQNSNSRYAYLDRPGFFIHNKEIAYQHKLSPFRKIIKPKIDSLVGPDHVVDVSSYREYNVSYCLHIDSFKWHKQMKDFQFANGQKNYNKAVLIPLIEGPEFKTTIFDIYSEEQVELDRALPKDWLTSSNNLDINDYLHMPQQHIDDLNKLPLIGEFEWKLGSVLLFDKCLLHCSTNFPNLDVTKKMIVLFLE